MILLTYFSLYFPLLVMPRLLEIVCIYNVRIRVSNRLECLLGMDCLTRKLVTVSYNVGNFSLYPRLIIIGSVAQRKALPREVQSPNGDTMSAPYFVQSFLFLFSPSLALFPRTSPDFCVGSYILRFLAIFIVSSYQSNP